MVDYLSVRVDICISDTIHRNIHVFIDTLIIDNGTMCAKIRLRDEELKVVSVVNDQPYGINIGEVARECDITRTVAGKRLEICARAGKIVEVVKSSKLKLYFPRRKG